MRPCRAPCVGAQEGTPVPGRLGTALLPMTARLDGFCRLPFPVGCGAQDAFCVPPAWEGLSLICREHDHAPRPCLVQHRPHTTEFQSLPAPTLCRVLGEAPLQADLHLVPWCSLPLRPVRASLAELRRVMRDGRSGFLQTLSLVACPTPAAHPVGLSVPRESGQGKCLRSSCPTVLTPTPSSSQLPPST